MRTAQNFTAIFKATVDRLPSTVRAALKAYWKLPAVDPLTRRKTKAPHVVLGKGWTQQAGARGVNSLANAGDGRTLVFDADFALEAPPEAAETLVAHELAHVYQMAKDGQAALNGQASEDEVAAYLKAWGFSENRIELWLAAKQACPTDPTRAFYSHLPHLNP